MLFEESAFFKKINAENRPLLSSNSMLSSENDEAIAVLSELSMHSLSRTFAVFPCTWLQFSFDDKKILDFHSMKFWLLGINWLFRHWLWIVLCDKNKKCSLHEWDVEALKYSNKLRKSYFTASMCSKRSPLLLHMDWKGTLILQKSDGFTLSGQFTDSRLAEMLHAKDFENTDRISQFFAALCDFYRA